MSDMKNMNSMPLIVDSFLTLMGNISISVFRMRNVVEDASGSITELERTRKQKDILEALEKVSWW